MATKDLGGVVNVCAKEVANSTLEGSEAGNDLVSSQVSLCFNEAMQRLQEVASFEVED